VKDGTRKGAPMLPSTATMRPSAFHERRLQTTTETHNSNKDTRTREGKLAKKKKKNQRTKQHGKPVSNPKEDKV
jgi:hypothetical protein